MNLKDQVCSLELAKKLKELGVKQESLWWWSQSENTGGARLYQAKQLFGSKDSQEAIISMEYPTKQYSAFTVSECLAIYREEITIPKGLTNVADFIAKKIVDKLSA